MASEDVSWTVDEVEALIMYVRDRRELYDQTMPGYSNRDRIDHLWMEICKEVRTKNAKQCRAKWQVLRGTYRTRKNEYTPSGSAKGKKKKWAYFEALSFLNPYISERKTSSNIDKGQDNSQEGSSSQDDEVECNVLEYESIATPQSDSVDCEVDENGFIHERSESAPTSCSTPLTAQSLTREKRKRSEPTQPSIETSLSEVMLTYFKQKASVPHPGASPTKKESSMQLFLKAVGQICDEKLNITEQLHLQMTILHELGKLVNNKDTD